MHVQIYKTGQHQLVAGVDDLDRSVLSFALRRQIGADCRNLALFDQNIGNTIDSSRVNDMTPLNEKSLSR
jgi:hypothetical protein